MPPRPTAAEQKIVNAAEHVRTWFRRRLDDQSQDIARLYRAERNRFNFRLRQVYDEYLRGDPTLRRARTGPAGREIERLINETADNLGRELGRASVEKLRDLTGATPRVMNRFMARATGMTFKELPDTTQRVLGELTTSVTAGGTFFDRVFSMGEDTKQQMFTTMRQSLLGGEDFETVRGKMMKLFGVDKLKAPKAAAYGPVRVYRNEAARQWNLLMGEIAEDEGAVQVWWAMIDTPNVTPGCVARHGRKISELGAAPPRHFNCRCTIAVFPRGTDLEPYIAEADAKLSAMGFTRRRAVYMEASRVVTAEFDPAEHPRDEKGRFALKWGDKALAPFGKMSRDEFPETSGPPAEHLYHTTGKDNLDDIATAGLKPHGPSFRGEQTEWPDGGREPRVYFATRPGGALNFAEPDHVLLRVRTDAAKTKGLKAEFRDRDYYTRRKSFDPADVEVMGIDGSWQPLVDRREALEAGWSWGRSRLKPLFSATLRPEDNGGFGYASIAWENLPALVSGRVQPMWQRSAYAAQSLGGPDHVLLRSGGHDVDVLTDQGWQPLSPNDDPHAWIQTANGAVLDAPDAPDWESRHRRLPLWFVERWPAMRPVTFPAPRLGEFYALRFADPDDALALSVGTSRSATWAIDKNLDTAAANLMTQPRPADPHLVVAIVPERTWDVSDDDVRTIVSLISGKVIYARDAFPPGLLSPYERVAVFAPVEDGAVWAIRPRGRDFWALPGGHVNAGESLEAAAVREMREETGVVVKLAGKLGVLYRPWATTHVFLALPISEREPSHVDESDAIEAVPIDWLGEDERAFVTRHLSKLDGVLGGV